MTIAEKGDRPGGSQARYIIRGARWPSALGIFFVGIFMSSAIGAPFSAEGATIFTVLGLAGAFFIRALVHPKFIVLDREGIRVRPVIGRTWFLGWDQLDTVSYIWLRHGPVVQISTVELQESGEKIKSWPFVTQTRQLGTYWAISSKRVADLIEEWHRYYS